MINSRTFKMPKAESILNRQFRDTYHNYISFLITLPTISDKEYMCLCYYLILQKRIKEANEIFKKINYNNIKGTNLTSLELQYDFLTAYLDFSDKSSDFNKAREICKKYNNFTIISWENMFKEINGQLNEYEGITDFENIILNEERTSIQKIQEEFLSLEIKNVDLIIKYKNISELIIKFYLIDIELLFSKSLFINTKIDFDVVTPNKLLKYKIEQNLSDDVNCKTIPIPQELQKNNFYIEVMSNNKKVYDIYYSSLLKYTIN